MEFIPLSRFEPATVVRPNHGLLNDSTIKEPMTQLSLHMIRVLEKPAPDSQHLKPLPVCQQS